jgi:hypothetical protein
MHSIIFHKKLLIISIISYTFIFKNLKKSIINILKNNNYTESSYIFFSNLIFIYKYKSYYFIILIKI